MVKVVSKNEYKNELIRSVKNLKEIYHYEFTDEDKLFTLLDQLAETLFECQYDNNKCPGSKILNNHNINESLRKEKDIALSKILYHKGSFF